MQIRNTSDKPDLSVHAEILSAIEAKGYRVMQDPEAAHYILQANILQVGKSAPTAMEAAINQGYGVSAVGGLMLASGAAYVGGASGRGIAAAGLVGALAEGIAGAAVKERLLLDGHRPPDQGADGRHRQGQGQLQAQAAPG